MDSHTLAEMSSGLASRVNNLAMDASGTDARTLLAEQDELVKLTMLAIVQDLDAERDDYRQAVDLLQDASHHVDAAAHKIEKVAKTIEVVAKAISAVEKVVA